MYFLDNVQTKVCTPEFVLYFSFYIKISMLKKGLHSPAHLFIDDAHYFITSSIYQKRPLLASPIIKNHLIKTIINCLSERNWILNDWVILDNHYHLLVKLTILLNKKSIRKLTNT